MHKAKRLFLFAPILALALFFSNVIPTYAIAPPPDSIVMDDYARCFGSVINTGDLLCVGQYEITYADCNANVVTGCPDENVTTAYLVSFVDTDGTTALRTVQPYTLFDQCCLGYTKGVFSIYFSAADVTSLGIVTASITSYFLQITPNPTVISSSAGAVLGIQSSLLAKGLLPAAIKARALDMESAWILDLLDNLAGIDRLNVLGETYFVNAIPNLRIMAGSNLFSNVAFAAEVDDKTHVVSYEQSLRNVMQDGGTNSAYWDTSVDNFATTLGMNGDVFWTFIAIALSIGMAAAMFAFSGGNVTMGLLGFGVTLPILSLIGIGTLGGVAIMAFVAAMGVGWVLFLKGA